MNREEELDSFLIALQRLNKHFAFIIDGEFTMKSTTDRYAKDLEDCTLQATFNDVTQTYDRKRGS